MVINPYLDLQTSGVRTVATTATLLYAMQLVAAVFTQFV
jgi:hypothetical protein